MEEKELLKIKSEAMKLVEKAYPEESEEVKANLVALLDPISDDYLDRVFVPKHIINKHVPPQHRHKEMVIFAPKKAWLRYDEEEKEEYIIESIRQKINDLDEDK